MKRDCIIEIIAHKLLKIYISFTKEEARGSTYKDMMNDSEGYSGLRMSRHRRTVVVQGRTGRVMTSTKLITRRAGVVIVRSESGVEELGHTKEAEEPHGTVAQQRCDDVSVPPVWPVERVRSSYDDGDHVERYLRPR